MKTIHAILVLTVAALVVSTFSFAAEPESRHHVKIKIAGDGDGDTIDLDIDDLEIGETRQFFTDSGKEVLLTREDDGIRLTVDGKEIEMPHHHGTGVHTDDQHVFIRHDGEGSMKKKIVIHKMGEEGEGHSYAFIHGDEGEDADDLVWVGHMSPAKRLLESGVLDDLDEAKRQEILDALGGEGSHHVKIHKKVVVEVDEEEEN